MEEKGDVSNEPIQNKNEEPTLEQPTNDLPSLISDIEEQLTDALFTKVLQSYWPRYCRLSSQGWPETTYVHPNLEYAGFASKVWEKDSFLWLNLVNLRLPIFQNVMDGLRIIFYATKNNRFITLMG